MNNSHRRLSVEFISEKDHMQARLIQSETKLITLETDLREMKADYESKLTNMESTIAAKEIHIKQLVQDNYRYFDVQETTAWARSLYPLDLSL